MQWVGYAELAAAVSNAGGLGIVRPFPQPLNNSYKMKRGLLPFRIAFPDIDLFAYSHCSSQLLRNPLPKISGKRFANVVR